MQVLFEFPCKVWTKIQFAWKEKLEAVCIFCVLLCQCKLGTNLFCAKYFTFQVLFQYLLDHADSGWTYYGRQKHLTGKSHFMSSNTSQTLCRLHKFTADDMRHLQITSVNNLFKSQLCRRCLEILHTRNISFEKIRMDRTVSRFQIFCNAPIANLKTHYCQYVDILFLPHELPLGILSVFEFLSLLSCILFLAIIILRIV